MSAEHLFKKNKYSVGIALSGGGVKGLCHVGCLQALEEYGVKPDILSGVSAGAIVAAFYADGYTPREICQLFTDVNFRDWTSFTIPRIGFFSIDPFIAFLDKNLRTKRIEDLPIPIRIVATNLDEGISQVFTQGNLVECVAASCAVPVLFQPRIIDDTHYVDGGVLMNFPARVIRHECEHLIGINASPMIANNYRKTVLGIAQRSYHFMFKANIIPDKAQCDYLIEPPSMENYDTFDTEKANEIFEIGYQYTKDYMAHLIAEHDNRPRIDYR